MENMVAYSWFDLYRLLFKKLFGIDRIVAYSLFGLDSLLLS